MICVGTFSGVTSPGMVISSALGGTERGNSSPTKARIMDVFPHCAKREGEREEREGRRKVKEIMALTWIFNTWSIHTAL